MADFREKVNELLENSMDVQFRELSVNLATCFDFDKLSLEIQFIIFSYLPAESLREISLVCRSWRTLANDNSLWKIKCSRMFSWWPEYMYFLSQQPKALDWKQIYIENHKAKEIPRSCLRLTRTIGPGPTKVVYTGEYLPEGCNIAPLRVAVAAYYTSLPDTLMEAELKISKDLDHPNICRLIGYCNRKDGERFATAERLVCWNHSTSALVSELLPLNLYTFLRQTQPDVPLSILQVWTILNDVACACKYLHSRKPVIILRNLILSKIYVTADLRCKLGGFSEATFLMPGLAEQDSFSKFSTQGFCAFFHAPELMQGLDYSEKVDVFAFAMLIWCLFPQQRATNSYEFSPADIHKGVRPPLANWIEDSKDPITLMPYTSMEVKFYSGLCQLAEHCWTQSPNERPSFDSIVQSLVGLSIYCRA